MPWSWSWAGSSEGRCELVLALNLTTLALVAVAIFLVAVPRMGLWAGLFLGSAVLPVSFGLPGEFDFAGIGVAPFEPFLFVGAIYCRVKYNNDAARRVALILGGAGVLGFALGVVHGNDSARLLYETKTFLIWVVCAYIGGCVVTAPDLHRGIKRVVVVSLWWSAVVTVLAASTGLQVLGAEQEAGLLGHYTGALRLQTAANFPALAVLGACLGASFIGRTKLRQQMYLIVPSFVILFLSFSRNSVLGLGVALLVAALANFSVRTLGSVVLKAGAVLAAFSVLSFFSPQMVSLPGGPLIAEQVKAYSFRVIGGLSSDVRDKDPSVQGRIVENRHMKEAIADSPVIGHGFGYHYQRSFGEIGSFTSKIGPYYGHNYFLWLWMKLGVLAAVVFGTWVRFLWRGIKSIGVGTTMATAGFAALVAVSVYAPVPGQSTSGVAFGFTLGLLVALTSRRYDSAAADGVHSSPEALSLGRPPGEFDER